MVETVKRLVFYLVCLGAWHQEKFGLGLCFRLFYCVTQELSSCACSFSMIALLEILLQHIGQKV